MANKKITDLRILMKKEEISACIVPGTDAHHDEYLPEVWKRREWISGFTGSAGDVVVTENKAGLWTDSRYWLQAREELAGSGITLFKLGYPGEPGMEEWLRKELPAGSIVGIDSALFSYRKARQLKKALAVSDILLKPVDHNLVDLIREDKPAFPSESVTIHQHQFCGESFTDKLSRVRTRMKEENVSLLVLVALDEIAWLFNIRGTDIPYNPVTIAWAAVSREHAYLFILPEKKTPELESYFNKHVTILPYADFASILTGLAPAGSRVWVDEDTVSLKIISVLKKSYSLYPGESPVLLFKAVKNETEIASLTAAHERDGIAMVRFLCWLEKKITENPPTEQECAEKLEEYRRHCDSYRGPSFRTIAAFGEHGAIVHYNGSGSEKLVKPQGLFLIDSGAQYIDGTTDITRTISTGKPTAEQKEMYTLVLKGHIALSTTSFPAGTRGGQLDVIARKPLWERGLDFGHGTGHGVGFYLSVHEGPQAISQTRGINVKLLPGMILTIEPGFYKEGEYGIRIENIVVVKEDLELTAISDTPFYCFEPVTLCPIDKSLIDITMLSSREQAFINDYHTRVFRKLKETLSTDEREWLAEKTAPLR